MHPLPLGVLSLLLALGTMLPASAQTIWYVDGDRPGLGDGRSWDHAFNDLSVALARAQHGDEVWVAQGTYTPGRNDPTATFRLKNGVGVYGGFVGGERVRSERKPTRFRTVLSGDLARDDVRGRYTDNVYHVVTGSGTDRTAILDGVVVTGGRTAEASDRSVYGGGMVIESGSPTVRNCVFRANGSMAGGGGVALFDDSRPLFDRTSFVENGGGAMYNDGSAPVIRNSLFRRNRAMDAGGAIVNVGGSQPLIVASAFTQNVAEGSDGGAIASVESDVRILASTFEGNRAPRGNGGALLNLESTVQVVNSVFVGNEAGRGGGGAVSSARSTVNVVNSVITDNTAGSVGGGVLNFASDVTLTNTILGENRAIRHPMQMVSFDRSDVGFDASLIDHSDWRRGAYWDAKVSRSGTSNQRQSPRFLAAPTSGPDGTWGTSDDDYGDLRLREDSPAIDNGFLVALNLDGDDQRDVTTDLFGRPRVQDGAVDIGPTEGTSRHVQAVREGDVVHAPNLGVSVAFTSLRGGAEVQIMRHPVVTHGPTSEESAIGLPEGTQLAQASRWEVELSRVAPGMVADVCITPDDPTQVGATAGLKVHKRAKDRGVWRSQPTTVRDRRHVCATGLNSFSEFVLVRETRLTPTRVTVAGAETLESEMPATPIRLRAPDGNASLRLNATPTNRSSGNTLLHYALPTDGPVSLRLYDVHGRLVYTVVDQWQSAGPKQAVIEPGTVAPGTYYVGLEAAGSVAHRRVVIAAPDRR